MSAARILLCAALAALTAHAPAQRACTYIHSGYLRGVPVRLPPTYLVPGLAHWRIIVHTPAECVGGAVSGKTALVCDHEARPRVSALPGHALLVRRGPRPRGHALVNVTVFCVFPHAPHAPHVLHMPHVPHVLHVPHVPHVQHVQHVPHVTQVPHVQHIPHVPYAPPVFNNRVKPTTEAISTTTPTPTDAPRHSNESTATESEAMSSSQDSTHSSSEEEEPPINRRYLRWKSPDFHQLPRKVLNRIKKLWQPEAN